MLLENRIGLVTGAGQGNGAAIAKGSCAARRARRRDRHQCGECANRTADDIRRGGGRLVHPRSMLRTQPPARSSLPRRAGSRVMSRFSSTMPDLPRAHSIDDPERGGSGIAALDVNLHGNFQRHAGLPGRSACDHRAPSSTSASIASFVSTALRSAIPPRRPR